MTESDNSIFPVLLVTHRAAKVTYMQSLVPEQEDDTYSLFLCFSLVTFAELQLLSLLAMEQLAGACSTVFDQALKTNPILEQFISLASSPPAEGDKQKAY